MEEPLEVLVRTEVEGHLTVQRDLGDLSRHCNVLVAHHLKINCETYIDEQSLYNFSTYSVTS